EPLKGSSVTLLEDLDELRNELLVRGDGPDRLGKRAEIDLRGLRGRRAAQLEAEKDTFLDSDPFADQATKRNRPEPFENGLEGSTVLRTEGLVRGQECLFVLG